MKRINEIREILSDFVEYEYGEILRKELNEIANKTYKKKYSDEEHLNFLTKHNTSIRNVHPQCSNAPYFIEMFCVLTQHIYADNIIELLDKAIDIEKQTI